MRTSSLKTPALASLLFLLNAYIIHELFSTEYTQHMGSIEAAYISLARYISQNWRDLTWFPLWYDGTPFHHTYPPFLHMLVASVVSVARISPALAHHAVTATTYCLGPVTLFWLAWRLSGSRIYSFFAGLLYSLLSPSIFLIPIIRHDIGSVFRARRLQALIDYGEGPHVTGMTLIPVAVLCLHLAIEKRRPVYYVLAALSAASVVLTNWLGAFGFAAAALSYLAARGFTGDWAGWLRAAGVAVLAYAFAAPWIPPSNLAAIRTNAQWIGGPYRMTPEHLKYAGLAIILFAISQHLFRRWKLSLTLQFAIYYFYVIGLVTLAAEWLDVFILPQPQRYHLEMEIALCLLIPFALKLLLDRFSTREKAIVATGALVFFAFQMKAYRHYAKYEIGSTDIRSTIEWRMSKWFDQNMQGRRVMAPGSVSFWMNAFTDTPQISGGFDQGIQNPLFPSVLFQILSGEGVGNREAEIAVNWLQVYGVHAVGVPGPASTEFFKPFAHPKKFEGVLKPLWRDGDNTVYEVPQRSASLAHIVRDAELTPRAPANVFDMDALRPYVTAIEDPDRPEAPLKWHSRHQAEVTANLQPGDLLSLQITYHRGWKAEANGHPATTRRDNLGLLAIEPNCQGPCTIELTFDGGFEALVARILFWLATLASLLWIVLTRLKPNRD